MGGEKEIIPIREKRQRYGICLVLRYPAARTVCEKHVTMKHRRKREGIRRGECKLVTALEEARYETLWEMMNHIWNIEENGFHQLKTYYHAKHCYCHGASEAICSMLILDFNMKELYLYRRLQGFIKSRISRKSVSQIFCDDLQTEKVKYILHRESG